MHSKNLAIPKAYARLDYEIPERYRNAFYLANAAFFDSSNWYLHRAYEVVFPTLKSLYRQTYPTLGLKDSRIQENLENVVESLDQCNSIIDIRFPVKRDNGKLEVVRGFRAHYGEAIRKTPCLGGLRIHEDITRDHMKALSMLSAMKNLCLGTGLSGAMGGIKINPSLYSENELKTIVNIYTNELFQKGYCNARDIVHPDINTAEREMMWISKAFGKCAGQTMNAAVTGKPLEHGGIEGYNQSAALGALKALETVVNHGEIMLKTGFIKTGVKGKKFIIEGLGKLGRPLSLMLVEQGAICVGVKEKDAYLYDTNGIDLDTEFQDLYKHLDEHGSIIRYGLSKTDQPESIFTEECDLLILAAFQKSLVCYIARDVKAKVILEAADGAITPTSHKILTTKSKLVVPDIYACAGGTVASYFEYLRNLQQLGLPEEEVARFSTDIYLRLLNNVDQKELQKISQGTQVQVDNIFQPLDFNFIKNSMACVYADVGEDILKTLASYRLGVDIKTAAYIVAIMNIFKAIFEQKSYFVP